MTGDVLYEKLNKKGVEVGSAGDLCENSHKGEVWKGDGGCFV